MTRYKNYSAYQRKLYSKYDINEEYLRTTKQRRVVQHLIEHVEGKQKYTEQQIVQKVSKAFLGTPLYRKVASAFTVAMLISAIQLTPIQASIIEGEIETSEYSLNKKEMKSSVILDDDSSIPQSKNIETESLHFLSGKSKSSLLIDRQKNEMLFDDESDVQISSPILTVIDTSIKDWKVLRDGVMDGEILILDDESDPLPSILAKLKLMNQVDSLNIFSHGSSGQLHFTNKIFTKETLLRDENYWKEIGNHLDKSGDILLYGCNVASQKLGENFVKTLADLTSADIAASINPTGSSLKGGDWKLEISHGEIKNRELFNELTKEMFQEVLAITIGSDRVDVESTNASGSSPSIKMWGDKIVVEWSGASGSPKVFNSDLTATTIPTITVSPVPSNGYSNMEYHTLSNGNMLIMWYSSSINNGITDLYYKIVDTTGTEVKSAAKINSSSAELNRYPDVTNLSNGNFLVVWARNGTNYGGREFQVDGTPVANQYSTTSALGLGSSTSKYRHQVAGNSSGKYMMLATYDSSSFKWGIFDNGSSSASVTGTISSNETGSSSVKVSALPNGNFLVLYKYKAGSASSDRTLYFTIISSTGSVVKSATSVGNLWSWGSFEDAIITDDSFILQYNNLNYGVSNTSYMKKYSFDGSLTEDLTNQLPTITDHKGPPQYYWYDYSLTFGKALLFEQTSDKLSMLVSSKESGEDNLDIWLLGTTTSTDSDADLTASATVTEPVSIPTTVDTIGEAVDLFDFTISDGGTADTLTTDITKIVVNVTGTTNDTDRAKVTWRLNGPDATNVTGVYNAGSDTITFSGLSISIADGANETYTVNGYFNDNTGLTEDQTFILSIDGDTDVTVDTSKTTFAGTSPVTNGSGTTIEVTATTLSVTTQPAGSVSGSTLTTQPVITAQDAFGNTDVDFTNTVTLSESSAGTLSGDIDIAAVSGVATFTDVVYTATADQESFTLTASDSSITDATANVVTSDVVATKLVFVTEVSPSTLEQGVTTDFSTDAIVKAVDDNNIIDTSFTELVTLSEDGAGSGSFTNNTATAVAGVATFSGTTLTHNTIETFNIIANDIDGTGSDLTIATSTNITSADTVSPIKSASSPIDNATAIDISDNLTFTFNENILKGTGDIVLYKTDGNSEVETFDVASSGQISVATNTLTLNPTNNLLYGESYYIQVANTAIKDNSGNTFTGISDTTTWNFTAKPKVVLSVNNTSITEAGGVATGTVSLQNSDGNSFTATSDVIVSLSYTGTATGGSTDYTQSTSSVTISTGNSSNTFTITGVDDGAGDDTETIIVDINSVTSSNAVEETAQQFTVTLTENESPVIGGVDTAETINDTATDTPFTDVTITDGEDDNVSVTVALDEKAKGTFTTASLTDSGFTDNSDGSYSLASTTTALAQAAIRQLIFEPSENRVVPTTSETTTFTITVNDGNSNGIDNTTTVTSTSVNDDPILSLSNNIISINEEELTRVSLENDISDVDVGQTLTITPTSSNSTIASVQMDGDFLVIKPQNSQSGSITINLSLSDEITTDTGSLNVNIVDTNNAPLLGENNIIDDVFEPIDQVTGTKPNPQSPTEYKEVIINSITYAVYSDADESGKLSIMRKIDANTWEYVIGYQGFGSGIATSINAKYNKRRKELSINFKDGSTPKNESIKAGNL